MPLRPHDFAIFRTAHHLPAGLLRVALVGGDDRLCLDPPDDVEIKIYKSTDHGGNGELRRILAALRAGSIDLVLVLRRWNGHSATTAIRRLCRKLGVACQVV